MGKNVVNPVDEIEGFTDFDDYMIDVHQSKFLVQKFTNSGFGEAVIIAGGDGGQETEEEEVDREEWRRSGQRVDREEFWRRSGQGRVEEE